MQVSVNGEVRETATGETLAALLASLGIDRRKVAVERNREIVPKSTFDRVVLTPGDELEIVQFVGGRVVSNMIDWSDCPEVERNAGKVSGAWLFRDTRVPVKALFENLEGGATVDQFLEWFPGVARGQIEAVLEHALRSLEVA